MKRNKRKGRGTVFLVLGLLLIVGGLGLCGYNLVEDRTAGATGEAVIAQLLDQIPTPVPALPELEENIEAIAGDVEHASYVEYPDYILDPTRDMPTKIIDGNEYLGVISVPTQGIELAVLADCSLPLLKIAPCRYAGTVYRNNLVIAAHNYGSHFGKLTRLSVGDKILFTDVEGHEFSYKVLELEVVQPTQTTYMTTGNWDLTLFTCTWGGRSRVTVRCERIGKQQTQELSTEAPTD